MTDSLEVYEYYVEDYRVIWKEPSGQHRYSQTCSTVKQAIERSARHDWPHVIVRVTRGREVVA